MRQLPGERGDRVARHLLQEIAARGEVVGEVALPDAGRSCDPGLRQLMRAALGKQLKCGFEDALADLHLVSLPNGGPELGERDVRYECEERGRVVGLRHVAVEACDPCED